MAKKDLFVVHGALLKCSQGSIPMILRVTSNRTYKVQNKNVATIMDNKPGVNVGLFGICKILTKTNPMPCVCATVMPWTSAYNSKKVTKFPPLLGKSTLQCTVGGKISISNTGQKKDDKNSKEVVCEVCKKKHPQDFRAMGTNRRGGEVGFAFKALNKGRSKADKIHSQNHLFYRELDKNKIDLLKKVLESFKEKLKANGVSKGKIPGEVYKVRNIFTLIPDSVCVHHLITVEAVGGTDDNFDEKWYNICYRYGYNINCAQNTVVLPGDMLSACHFKVPLHKGNHEYTSIKGSELITKINYITQVVSLTKKIKQAYNKEKRPCEEIQNSEIIKFHEKMLKTSEVIFDRIRKFEWCISSDGFHYSQSNHIGCLDYCKTLESKKKVLSEKFGETRQTGDSMQGFFFKVMDKIDDVKKGCPAKRIHTAEGCKLKPVGFWNQARYNQMPTNEELGLK